MNSEMTIHFLYLVISLFISLLFPILQHVTVLLTALQQQPAKKKQAAAMAAGEEKKKRVGKEQKKRRKKKIIKDKLKTYDKKGFLDISEVGTNLSIAPQ